MWPRVKEEEEEEGERGDGGRDVMGWMAREEEEEWLAQDGTRHSR